MSRIAEQRLVSPEALRQGYEPQRISIRALVVTLVLFIVSMVGLQALLWWMMNTMEARDRAADRPESVLKIDQAPSGPSLQPSLGHEAFEAQDLEQTRRSEDAIFSRLGWGVEPATHRVTIPPEILRAVAEQQRARSAADFVPPTTTGKKTNSILPATIPSYDTTPEIEGGKRP